MNKIIYISTSELPSSFLNRFEIEGYSLSPLEHTNNIDSMILMIVTPLVYKNQIISIEQIWKKYCTLNNIKYTIFQSGFQGITHRKNFLHWKTHPLDFNQWISNIEDVNAWTPEEFGYTPLEDLLEHVIDAHGTNGLLKWYTLLLAFHRNIDYLYDQGINIEEIKLKFNETEYEDTVSNFTLTTNTLMQWLTFFPDTAIFERCKSELSNLEFQSFHCTDWKYFKENNNNTIQTLQNFLTLIKEIEKYFNSKK